MRLQALASHDMPFPHVLGRGDRKDSANFQNYKINDIVQEAEYPWGNHLQDKIFFLTS